MSQYTFLTFNSCPDISVPKGKMSRYRNAKAHRSFTAIELYICPISSWKGIFLRIPGTTIFEYLSYKLPELFHWAIRIDDTMYELASQDTKLKGGDRHGVRPKSFKKWAKTRELYQAPLVTQSRSHSYSSTDSSSAPSMWDDADEDNMYYSQSDYSDDDYDDNSRK